ncbi:hypothetical protein M081_3693, partial [Bacteroides fragilis str. 3998 T(B) 4]
MYLLPFKLREFIHKLCKVILVRYYFLHDAKI